LTIGHSTHPIDAFIALLKQQGVTALADVRSHPYSRHFPQYSKDALKKCACSSVQIAYVFLGKELGSEVKTLHATRQGKVQYDLAWAGTLVCTRFKERLRQGLGKYQIAPMCAEKDLVGIVIVQYCRAAHVRIRTPVQHIHADGHLEEHRAMSECSSP
jgi:hypothetical protein